MQKKLESLAVLKLEPVLSSRLVEWSGMPLEFQMTTPLPIQSVQAYKQSPYFCIK